MIETLLTTKFHIPPVPARGVKRSRLIEDLNQSLQTKLTLISAPAGFGKTTLVSMWAEQASMPVIWLSLDADDNDLTRFLSYLIVAFQRIDPDLGKHALEILVNPQIPSYETILTSLLNDLTGLDNCITLVFDDYHLIETQGIHDAVIFLLDHLPKQVHLIFATRADPPLPLPRLRARAHLVELRQDDLRFTTEEATIFLNDLMGLGLSIKDVAALESRTEGWVSGLQMASLSLKKYGSDPVTRAAFIHAFTGSHRYILDYLVEEVLDQQSPIMQEFLLKTSILKRLCSPLCEAILVDPDRDSSKSEAEPHIIATLTSPQAILEYLEAANLFIVPLDDERYWYRYHRLFADLLQQRLRASQPDSLPGLHQRASIWYEEQGLVSEAIDHALAAQDYKHAASLVEQASEATLIRSEIATFLAWIEKLPDEWVRTNPNLCFFHTWALIISGRSQAVIDQRLQDITIFEDAAEANDIITGRIKALRACFKLFQIDLPGAKKLAYQALECMQKEDTFTRGLISWILSMASFVDGNLKDSNRLLKETARIGQELSSPMIAVMTLTHLARLQMRQGHLHQSHRTLQRALQLATDANGRLLPIASEALLGLGMLEREWNDLATAADHLTESIELSRQWSELAAFDAYFPLARVRLAQGDLVAARLAIETAREIAQKSEGTEWDDIIVEYQQAYISAIQKDITTVMDWAAKRGLLPGNSYQSPHELDNNQEYIREHLQKYEQLILARLFIYQSKITEALALLESLLAQVKIIERPDLTIEVQILKALAFQVKGDEDHSMESLSEALFIAESGGYIRIFLDEGQPMIKLLRLAASRGIFTTYVIKLLAAFGGSVSTDVDAVPLSPFIQPLIEPLSGRELEVLRLLVTTMSVPEIANKLVLATTTVRSHCKSIYSKMNVHKRWDAVQRAQELGLI